MSVSFRMQFRSDVWTRLCVMEMILKRMHCSTFSHYKDLGARCMSALECRRQRGLVQFEFVGDSFFRATGSGKVSCNNQTVIYLARW